MARAQKAPEAAVPGDAGMPRLVTPAMLREWPLPAPTGDKSGRGQVLVIGGARRTPGAALLSSLAALRMGAGRLTIAVAEGVAAQLAVAVPESGVHGLPEDRSGSVTGERAGELLADEIKRADGILVGPGLDDAEGAIRLLEEVAPLIPRRVPVVLDAYAFTVLPRVSDRVRQALSGRLITNCNTEELAMVTGDDEIPLADVAEPAGDVAKRYGAVVSCHGWVVDDEGGVWRVTTGDTGLGTSGTGDVLAGAIVGLACRGAARPQGAVWGAYVHAAAGDTLAARFGRVGYLASDLLPELPLVLSSLRGD